LTVTVAPGRNPVPWMTRSLAVPPQSASIPVMVGAGLMTSAFLSSAKHEPASGFVTTIEYVPGGSSPCLMRTVRVVLST
jgi:hypothetical protein